MLLLYWPQSGSEANIPPFASEYIYASIHASKAASEILECNYYRTRGRAAPESVFPHAAQAWRHMVYLFCSRLGLMYGKLATLFVRDARRAKTIM